MKQQKQRLNELLLLLEAHCINNMDCTEILQTMYDEFGFIMLPECDIE